MSTKGTQWHRDFSYYWPDFDQTQNRPLNRYQLSRWHLSRQYISWQHLSISGISQPLLTGFFPNCIGKFLGPYLTDANCHGDICPANICPDNICPYNECFSCYWPDFDKTFWTQHFCGAKILWTQNCFGPNFFFDLKFPEPKLTYFLAWNNLT